jgi:hypothetical protein
MTRDRAELLADIADDVKELTVDVRTAAEYAPDGGGSRRYRLRHHGLLYQLVAALQPGSAAGSNRPGGKPSGRSPVNESAHNTLDAISGGWATRGTWVVGAYDLRRRLCVSAGQRRLRSGPGLIPALRDVRALAHTAQAPDLELAGTTLRAYVNLAKRALDYDAPTATLRDVVCPYCGGDLRVAADASSDVWCVNTGCVDEEGRRHWWPRREWVFLLERMGVA